MPNLYSLPIVEDKYSYKYEITLDGTVYIINMQYNSRKDGWFVSLHGASDIAIISGLKVKMGNDLLSQFRHKSNIPAGRLVVLNWEDKEEANLANFGTKVLLSYIGES